MLIIGLLLLAFVLLWVERNTRIGKNLGGITLAYIIGIIAANTLGRHLNSDTLKTLTEISVVFSIPAVLFSAPVGLIIKQSRRMLPSFSFAVLGAGLGSVIAYWSLGNGTVANTQSAAMLAGVYSGGTPNLSAVGTALNAPESLFVLLNAGDTLFSAVYLIFLLTVGPRIISYFLTGRNHSEASQVTALETSPRFLNIIVTLIFSAITITLSYLIISAFFEELNEALFFLVISALSLLVGSSSLGKFTTGSYQVGYWFLLVFALSLGAQSNLTLILENAREVLPFVAIVIGIALLVTYLLAFTFHQDRDNTVVASVAAVFGPPFIATICQKIQRPDLVAAGISCGLLGYALGNFLGLGVAYLLGL
jgi:uncharacterized membrane protein